MARLIFSFITCHRTGVSFLGCERGRRVTYACTRRDKRAIRLGICWTSERNERARMENIEELIDLYGYAVFNSLKSHFLILRPHYLLIRASLNHREKMKSDACLHAINKEIRCSPGRIVAVERFKKAHIM